jgi:cytochrome c-type biogenesis protein CcmH/NrfG
MSTKSALKAAKAAIDAKNWPEAKSQADLALEKDNTNYFALLFLGRANAKLSLFDDAAKAYNAATKLKPDEAQAWLGLREMYESMGSEKVGECTDAGVRLADIYMNA